MNAKVVSTVLAIVWLAAPAALAETRLAPGVKPSKKQSDAAAAKKQSGNAAPKPSRRPVETVETRKNKKGKIDRWIYRRDGVVYKREYDRNGDGRADFRVLEDHGIFLQKEYDLRYDGTFDKIEKAPARGSSGRVKTISGEEVPS